VRATLRRRASSVTLGITALCAAGCPAAPPTPSERAPASATIPHAAPSSVGSLTPPIDTGAPVADAAPTVVGAAHILVAYKGALGAAPTIVRSKADAKKRAGEAHEKLVAHQGTFEELVAKYSDDGLSKPAGGKLGNFERNVFPPAFSDAAFGLALGGVSDVVETPRGFHVIVRTK
jgi:peptidyl-prolyl cis-trans isomerase NIMA-interacting 1